MYKLDKKDLKILSELDSNSRQSNNQIGKKTKLSKEVVKYRIDNLIKNNIIIKFQTITNYFKLGIVKFKLYLRLTNANKEKINEIALDLKYNINTEWVSITTGRWDIIASFLVHNVNEFDDEVQNLLNKFSNHIQEKAMTTTLYLAHHKREFLSPTKEISKIIYHTSKDKQEKIDQIDEEIIKLITNNARQQVTEIAKKLKITPRIAQYKLKELEKKNIILAYKTHLDPKSMGRLSCKAIIYLSNTPKNKLEHFINYASNLPGAVWPQRVIGNWDFELDFELENYDEFQDIILNLKEKFPDIIKNHEFCIMSKEYKLDFYPNAHPIYNQ
ncbi:MAG: Lrp/AsnC family transcriptional regulator [Candidatus Woesearchaeota archaeon]|jgi:Lrp/AsnC family leucine-responsive transcriptional regulator